MIRKKKRSKMLKKRKACAKTQKDGKKIPPIPFHVATIGYSSMINI